MAKLNEPPPAPGESIEALKRRFIRQNRDLARTNSQQSLKIRGLEVETSRLLSENITYREENINLKKELHNAQLTIDHVGTLKILLDKKLGELSSLFTELGKPVVIPPELKTSTRRKSRPTLRRASEPRSWVTAEILAEAEGRLPPISEDNIYPAKALDLGEIDLNATESSGFVTSPELGPPPIAHFDDGDPVKRDPALSKLPSPSKTASDDQDLSSEPGFANLETRRKRRESTFAKDAEETGHVPETPALKPSVKVNTPAPSQILKIGAKRKLSVRDDGDQENPSKAKSSENDGFLYTRKSSAPSTKDQPTRKVSQEKSTLNAKRDKPREVSASLSTARKALGEKSVNTDPVTSPVKSKPGLAEKAGDPKKEIKKSHNRPKRETPVVRPITPLESRSTTPSELPPVTPGAPGLDLSTPTKTDPSTNRQESRDTPPPDDLNVRPSRRQRSAVSYAEPSLRDKMRRPTKDLVDAVGADVKFVRAAANPEAQSKSFTDRSSRSVSVKKESDSSESTDWKNLPLRTEPTSPLGKKSSPLDENDDLPASILAGDRRRRASAMYHSEDTNSASNTAIAALVLAGSQKRLSRARQSAAVARANGFDGDGIDLSELHHALPDVEEPKVNSLTKLQRTSRRHSSLADLGKINAEKEREMGKLNMERELGKEKVKPAQVLARAQGRADITRSGRVTPDSEDGSVNGRVGMRRKSMMV